MPTPFTFTDDHDDFRSSVRSLVRGAFADSYLARSKGNRFPWDEQRKLGSAGLLALGVPEADGGQGADPLFQGIACEEAGYADIAIGHLVFNGNVNATILSRFAQDTVKSAWLPGILAGDITTCLALTEPGSGSDAAAMRTTARRVDGGWVLAGEKTSVSQAPHANIAAVFAKTDPAAGARGVSAFLVPLDDPAVSRQTFDDPGFKAVGRGALVFDELFVPNANLLGEEGAGFRMVMSEFDLTRSVIGLICLGAAQRALDMTSRYVTQREAFGTPISRNQGVSFPLAEHTTYVEAARLLAYRALALRTAGLPHTREAAMVKWWAPEVAFNAIKDCIVLHGQVGYSDEFPLQAMLRDVSGYFIGDGTAHIQKLVIARDLLGRENVDGPRAN